MFHLQFNFKYIESWFSTVHHSWMTDHPLSLLHSLSSSIKTRHFSFCQHNVLYIYCPIKTGSKYFFKRRLITYISTPHTILVSFCDIWLTTSFTQQIALVMLPFTQREQLACAEKDHSFVPAVCTFRVFIVTYLWLAKKHLKNNKKSRRLQATVKRFLVSSDFNALCGQAQCEPSLSEGLVAVDSILTSRVCAAIQYASRTVKPLEVIHFTKKDTSLTGALMADLWFYYMYLIKNDNPAKWDTSLSWTLGWSHRCPTWGGSTVSVE